MDQPSILITGGTGSLGRALIDRLLQGNDYQRIISLSRDEVKAGDLADTFNDPRLRVFLGDVRDQARLELAFHGVDVVVHAAALKRVQQSAYSPGELVKTNVVGTMNTLAAALAAGVRRVLFISSDKSVHPTNLYGSTKQIAETYAVQFNSYSHPRGTAVAAVRYGNVLASRGSVVPIWQAAVERGDPIRLTDGRMTRFWLTLTDACDLVVRCLADLRGGEVFVPILPSVRMLDVAAAIGGPGYPVEVVGLRPGGEKLDEQLLSDEEIGRTNEVDGLYLVKPSHHSWTAEPWPGVPAMFQVPYRSDTNERFLTVEEIRDSIAHIPDR